MTPARQTVRDEDPQRCACSWRCILSERAPSFYAHLDELPPRGHACLIATEAVVCHREVIAF